MAAVGTNNWTLADWAKTQDPDGKTATIVELLSQTNEILSDMMWIEGNLPTGHRTTQRTSLPSVGYRRLNEGVAPTKSTTAQVDDACAIMEAFSETDCDLANLNGNVAQFRLQEAQAFLEAMNQQMAQTLFYGNQTTDPKEFTGFAPRYNDTTAANGQNIVDAGGSGSDNTSVWLVLWGPNTAHGVFPKGAKAGLIHEDLGIETVEDSSGNRLRAYRDRFQWKCGLSLRDWRFVVRIANIDVSDLVDESGAADLIKVMIKSIHRLPNLNMGKPAFYMNRTVRQMLDIQAMSKTNVYLTVGEEEGKLKTTMRGIPLRTVDALTNAEAQVT